MESYASREFDARGAQRPCRGAGARLSSTRWGASGWDFSYLPDLGISLALPLRELGPPQPEEGGERRWSRDSGADRADPPLRRRRGGEWHAASRRADARPDRLVTVRSPDLMVTGGVLADGRGFYTRSDRTAEGWATVYLAAPATQTGELNLIASSIRPGAPALGPAARRRLSRW